MADKSEIANLLPQIAALRRSAVAARRSAHQMSDPITNNRLRNEANDLDHQAEAIEVRLAILKAALRASEPSDEIAAFKPLLDWNGTD
jgi:hypothetical protein